MASTLVGARGEEEGEEERTDITAEKDLKEGSEEVVDSLHVSTGGMSNRPDV